MPKAGKHQLIESVALVRAALLPQKLATMATISRPIGQLPPAQVKGSRHQLQLEQHLDIIILMAAISRPTSQLPPGQVKGSHHQLQLVQHLDISILHAHSTAQSLKRPMLIAQDRD